MPPHPGTPAVTSLAMSQRDQKCYCSTSGRLRTALKQQAAEQLAVAGAACNQLRWTPPAVVFHFAGGASAEVAAELRAMGITVTGQHDLPALDPATASCHLEHDVQAASWRLMWQQCPVSSCTAVCGQAGLALGACWTTHTRRTWGRLQWSAGPGPITPEQLPPPPPPPAAANADVTTLCALVSEVTNADPTLPALHTWAARTCHWRVRCDQTKS